MKPFNKLTPSQQRVAIARDAIKQIKARRYKVETGAYFEPLKNERALDQKLLKQKSTRCKVCQLGATMASYVRLGNEHTLYFNGSDDRPVRNVLEGTFSLTQLTMMEVAFENAGSNIFLRNYGLGSKEFTRCLDFRERHRRATDAKRAIAIFQNIIKNKGTFKP